MKRGAKTGEEPLNTFALIVVGLEMLAVVAIVWYACTGAANVGRAPTWFGERVPVAPPPDTVGLRGPKGK